MNVAGINALYAGRKLQEAEEVETAAEQFSGSVQGLKDRVGNLMGAYEDLMKEFQGMQEIVGIREDWPFLEDIRKLTEFFDNELSDDFRRGRI